ncbi:MAG: hypothetical protein R3F33_08575 [Planctomycetota bacterium]
MNHPNDTLRNPASSRLAGWLAVLLGGAVLAAMLLLRSGPIGPL